MGKRKKIVVWEVYDFIGGGQKMSLIISEVLRKHFNLEFIVPGEGALTEKLKEMKIPYTILPLSHLSLGEKSFIDVIKYICSFPKIVYKVTRLLKKVSADILYVPGPSVLPLGAIAGQLSRVPVIWHIHHMFSDHKTLLLLKRVSGFKYVYKILAPTDIANEQIQTAKNSGKLLTIYNPIDLETFVPRKSKDDVMSEFGIGNEDYVIQHIGLIQHQKNQELSIHMLRRLHDCGFSTSKLMIIGEASSGETEYEKKLHLLVEELNLKDYVIFTGYREDVCDLLSIATVVVIMREEGFSLVALEAMAEKKPVVTVDVGGVSEIVKKSNAGLLFAYNADAIENCASAVIDLFVNPEKRKRLGENGFRFAQANKIDSFKKRIEEVFNI